jgi:fructose-bisphosphate aldolase, class II
MPLASTREIIDAAAAAGRGVGAFNVIHLEHAEAMVAGAELVARPVIMQISENAVRFHGSLEPIMVATLAVARAAPTPVAVHLDHARDVGLVREAVALGVPSVMFDASELPYEENVAATAAVVEHCHSRNVWVEAELGEIGGKDGVHAPGARTDPAEAKEFVAGTGVDALAVAVGTSHAMTTRDATLDLALIAALKRAVSVPLVLHGSSGVADHDLIAGVAAGMTKVNIATHLNQVFTTAVRDYLNDHPEVVDTRKYLGVARQALARESGRLLELLAAPPP